MIEEGSMQLEKFAKAGTFFLGSCALILALVPAGVAAPYKSCKCKATGAILQSEFLGYYPTCWRTWPGGERVCPSPSPAKTDEGPIPLADAPPTAGKTAAPKGEALEKLGPPKIESIK
jgi:hypothetical protein